MHSIILPETIYPTPEMESLVPTPEEYYIGSGETTARFIFSLVEYTDFELAKISEFRIFASTTASDEEILRILLSNKFNFKNTLKALLETQEWASTNTPDGYRSLYAEPSLCSIPGVYMCTVGTGGTGQSL